MRCACLLLPPPLLLLLLAPTPTPSPLLLLPCGACCLHTVLLLLLTPGSLPLRSRGDQPDLCWCWLTPTRATLPQSRSAST